MLRAAVLGAGYMGSAITFPLAENGHRVHLWGTWLDDELLDGAREGKHPRLGKPLPQGVRTFYSRELEEAVQDADVVCIAVTSDGFLPVFEKLLGAVDKLPPVFGLTKGFVEREGSILSISESAAQLFSERFGGQRLQWVSIGGPVKAVELANRIPTATVFGYADPGVTRFFTEFATSYYRVFSVGDIPGVELSSALKNVYAIGMGICDGFYEQRGIVDYHNFKAFIFNQAVREMALFIGEDQGKRDTVFDLAGVGDLYVTSASGRNGIFGRRIGMGGNPAQEYRVMRDAGEVAEGYHTLALFVRFMEQRGNGLPGKLPLLSAIYRILYRGGSPRDELLAFNRLSGGAG